MTLAAVATPAPAPPVSAVPGPVRRAPHAALLDRPSDLFDADAVPAPPSTPLAIPYQMDQALRDAQAAGEHLGATWQGSPAQPGAGGFVAAALQPPPSGAATQAELATLHQLATTRTPEGIAAARYHERYGSVGIWRRELGRYREEVGHARALPAAIDVARALALNGQVTLPAKARFDRDRPFTTDPTLPVVLKRPRNDSYPSGHTSSAYAAATVLSHYMPHRRDHLLDLAAQVAFSRSYGGVHFPSDTVAGAFIGSAAGRIVVDQRPASDVPASDAA